MFTPASRPKAAKLPSLCYPIAGTYTGDGAVSPALGTPVFTPASRPKAAKLPSLCYPIAGTYTGMAKRHPRQERRCSHRHRGRRPRKVAPLPHSRDPSRGWRNVTRARSAGVHTGIAAKGRETPVALLAHSRDPIGDGAVSPALGTPVFTPASRPKAAKLPSLRYPIAGTNRGWRNVHLGRASPVGRRAM